MQLNSNTFKSVYLSKKLIIKLGENVTLVRFFVLIRFFYNAKRMEKMSNRRKPISKDKIDYLLTVERSTYRSLLYSSLQHIYVWITIYSYHYVSFILDGGVSFFTSCSWLWCWDVIDVNISITMSSI